MNKRCRYIVYLILTSFMMLLPSFQMRESDESTLIAAFLERFTRFVEWPENTEANASQQFILGVCGSQEYYEFFSDVFASQKIKGKTVKVRLIKTSDEAKKVNMLFIGDSYENRLTGFLDKLKGVPVLTVSYSEGFSKKGVHINLIDSDGRLKFEINSKTLAESGLKMSSLLLQQAKRVYQ